MPMFIKECLKKDILDRLFIYDKETGILRNRINRGKVLQGEQAGTINKRKHTSYFLVCIGHKNYPVHRIGYVMTYGDIPSNLVIDHINGNGLDNRICNLRAVTHEENVSRRRGGASGHVGVYFQPSRNKWLAQMRVNGKLIHAGSFLTKEEAIAARKALQIKYKRNFGGV